LTLSGFDRFIWAAGFAGNLALLFVLFRRYRARPFPIFTAWIALSVVRTVVLYVVLNRLPTGNAYTDFYSSFNVVDEVLQFLVICELAFHVFRPTGVWARDVRKTFVIMLFASAVVALSMTWLSVPPTRTALQGLILRGNFFSAALMSELFAAIVVLSATAGLPWKTHVARIAQGLGAYSFVCVARDIALHYVGLSADGRVFTELSHLRILSYLGCQAYWIVMLWQEAPAPRALPESMRTQIFALQERVEYDLLKIRAWRRD
jgi:hypothetical protein